MKKVFAALVCAGVASLISFVTLNALITSGINGAYRYICVDGDVSSGLVLFLGLALVGTVPASVFIGCAIASSKPRLTWRRLGYGLGLALAAIGVVYVVSYAGAVLAHVEQRSCVARWTFVAPAETMRVATQSFLSNKPEEANGRCGFDHQLRLCGEISTLYK